MKTTSTFASIETTNAPSQVRGGHSFRTLFGKLLLTASLALCLHATPAAAQTGVTDNVDPLISPCQVLFGGASWLDSGYATHVALNNNNYVAEVHSSGDGPSDLWYHFAWIDRNGVHWSHSFQYDTGHSPSIALNDNNCAVEVHCGTNNALQLWYHVGSVASVTGLTLGASYYFDQGGYAPSVALNNSNTVVEVHCGVGTASSAPLWCRVGTVNGDKINWGTSFQYDQGYNPSVAINSSNTVVEVHRSSVDNTLWYHVGTVSGKTVNWGAYHQYDYGYQPSVAITSDGEVIETHVDGNNKIYKKTGHIYAGTLITWLASVQYDNGINPQVGCNDWIALETHMGGEGDIWWSGGLIAR